IRFVVPRLRSGDRDGVAGGRGRPGSGFAWGVDERERKAGKMKDWYKDAVFYEVFVRSFKDGNGDGIGDFVGMTEKLDYVKDLGVTCLWLLPMYPSPLKDDGYDIADYYNI